MARLYKVLIRLSNSLSILPTNNASSIYLVNDNPITGKHLDTGMSVAELSAAALQYSDNTTGAASIRAGLPATWGGG